MSASSSSQGRSKAQMCLKRIIDFISSHSSNGSLVHIDLDSEPNEVADMSGGGVSTVDDKSCEGDPKSKEEQRLLLLLEEEEEEDETRQSSDITNQQTSSGIETQKTELEEVGEERKTGGYLELLVEAARLISGDLEEDDSEVPPTRRRTGKDKIEEEEEPKEKWMPDSYFEEDISPIVRSKRGRNQVLPYRYRDSVLEPWKKKGITKQRSSRVSGKQMTK